VRDLANRRALPDGIPYAPDRVERFGTPGGEMGPWMGPGAKAAEKAAENLAHETHAKETAADAAAGGTTARQGENHPAPSPEQIDPGYRSRMHAIRRPDGTIVFTNVPGEYGLTPPGGGAGSLEAPGGAERVRYEEAIEELGGSISTPMTAASGATAYTHPESPPTVPLESRPPMSERDIIERGASEAAAEGDPTDTRSIMERRAWTEHRLAQERLKAMEEAEIAEKELAADPRFALAMAQAEGQARWGAELIEQQATEEQRRIAREKVAEYAPRVYAAMEAGDQEGVKRLDAMLRMELRALGLTVPEPRVPGIGDALLQSMGGMMDERLEEQKAKK
jgi:hypothetical protein